VIGLGCNNFGKRIDFDQTRIVLDSALDLGITFLDTADRYGETHSEEFMGEILEGRRDRVVLATKFGMDVGDGWTAGPRGRSDYIRHAVDASLKRLRTDVIDLYYYHWPDKVTPILETLTGLDELVRAGKVRAIGACNFSAAQIEEADTVAREHGLTRFTAIQNEYSLLVRDPEADALAVCERLDLAFIPYFPLAAGLLTGKYHRNAPAPAGTRLVVRDELATPEQWDVIEKVEAFAAARGVSMTDVAIGALLAEPSVASVIAGATKPDQLRANAGAAGWIPDATELAQLRAALA